MLDRGLKALENYKEFDKNDAVFVGRINTNRKVAVVRSLMTEDTDTDLGQLELVEDVIVHLCKDSKNEDTEEFRVVKARFNGIKVILYMTLITAMLIMIYKRLNDIGYTEAKFCFKLEMEEWIIELHIAIRTGELDHRKAIQATRCRIP